MTFRLGVDHATMCRLLLLLARASKEALKEVSVSSSSIQDSAVTV